MRKLELVVAVLATLLNQQPTPDNQPQKPVKFTVVDRLTKKPLTEFSYSLSISVPGEIGPTREAKEPDRVDVKSPAGTFVVQAPASCKLELDVVSPDVVVGFQHGHAWSFSLRASDAKREFVVGVEVGIPVRGVVRDAATKKPIAGANVSPIIDMHQARGPFRERAVKTDADGRFEVRGVNPDWGALVEHRETDLMEYRIPHLWPGEWTIKLLERGNVVASGRVKISGREAVTKDLVVTTVRTVIPDRRIEVPAPRGHQ